MPRLAPAAACLVLALAATTLRGADGPEWEPVVDPENQVFPSFIIATSTLKLPPSGEEDPCFIGHAGGLLGIRLANPKAGTKVKLTVECAKVLAPSSVEGVLAEAGEVYSIFPKIKWNYDALLDLVQQVPAEIVFTLTLDGGAPQEKSQTVTLRPINDCPWAYVEGDDEEDEELVNLNFMFAAYVNENHPWIDELLKEALAAKVVDQFDGYQSADPQQVVLQAYAIWRALQERGIKYSSITDTAAHAERVYAQHVRFIDQSVGNQQANCVDGSVIFASALRKIGIDVALVLVPGHCFVAFKADPDGKEIVGLETTALGNADLQAEAETSADDGEDLLPEERKHEASARTFDDAVESANQALKKHARRFDDPQDAECEIIWIGEARKLGVMPLAYRRH